MPPLKFRRCPYAEAVGNISSGEVVGVIGLGYVGLPLAIELADRGLDVIGFDIDEALINGLGQGQSHTTDVGSSTLQAALAGGLRLSASSLDLAECSTFVICVPTPLAANAGADTSSIEQAVAAIAPHIRAGSLVVLESTSYPGTTEEIVAQPLGEVTGLMPGVDFCVAFSPERIDPGNRIHRLHNTPKIVAGLKECCREKAKDLYARVSIRVVEAWGVREAEFAKLLENTYRQVNIALVNEMVKFTGALGVDLQEAIRLASTKPFGFEAFYPGPGVGGHCIPIDPQYLAARVESVLGQEFRFVALAREINAGMPEFVVNRLAGALEDVGVGLTWARVLLLGITYKRDVTDMRKAPAEEIVRGLRKQGASVAYFDPFVDSWQVDGEIVDQVESLSGPTEPFDGLILVTDHSTFHGQDYRHLARVCLDTRGVLAGDGILGLD